MKTEMACPWKLHWRRNLDVLFWIFFCSLDKFSRGSRELLHTRWNIYLCSVWQFQYDHCYHTFALRYQILGWFILSCVPNLRPYRCKLSFLLFWFHSVVQNWIIYIRSRSISLNQGLELARLSTIILNSPLRWDIKSWTGSSCCV